MSWTGNSARFAARTMTTLFLAGADMAPACQVAGESIQVYLQRHFLAMAGQVATTLRDCPNLVGYGFLNELGTGYLGTRLDQPLNTTVSGPRLSGFDGMVLAAGVPHAVPHALALGMAPIPIGKRVLNQGRVRAWCAEAEDCWQAAGIWALQGGKPVLLRPDHFVQHHGRPIDAHHEYVLPLVERFATTVQQAHPGALILVENGVLGQRPTEDWQGLAQLGLVNATHWYDAMTLFSRRWIPRWSYDVYRNRFIWGPPAIQQMFVDQIALIKAASEELMGNCPTLIGEFGVPFDLDNGLHRRNGTYVAQIALLQQYYAALDANLVSATQWNYTADNDHPWGDQWNREDLTVFSEDDRGQGEDGARALRGFSRPYAPATAGTPQRMHFDPATRTFTLTYDSDPAITAPTEIVIPRIQYPNGITWSLSSGRAEYDAAARCLRVWEADPGPQSITIHHRATPSTS
jgi:hypothetical protein